MDGEKVLVSEDNEHLGLIVSGTDQESKNVDQRISKGRKALFSLLGPAFNSKSLLSPMMKCHIYKTYISPIIRSGLSTFALKSSNIETISLFHRKTLRGILNYSKSSNIPSLHFLLGELPIEGQIHKDIFMLFYSVWSNPQHKIHELVKHLLKTSPQNSRTWSIHLKILSEKYGLSDPIECLKEDAPTKSSFKELVETKITAFYEKELRTQALENSCMKFFNVSLIGLRGRPHPALSNITTPHQAKKAKQHLKMLGGDYFTYEKKSKQSREVTILQTL